jgi:hypothetical protein
MPVRQALHAVVVIGGCAALGAGAGRMTRDVIAMFDQLAGTLKLAACACAQSIDPHVHRRPCAIGFLSSALTGRCRLPMSCTQ